MPDLATITGNAGSHHFAVHSYGDTIDLLVNTTDPYEGEVIIPPGTVLLAVTSEEAWKIEITAR
jgi:hypothetical protein